MLARLLTLRVDLRDPDAAAEVTPEALAAYAERTGWRLAETTAAVRVYHRADIPLAELQIPLHAAWPDYGACVVHAITTLAEHEGRSPLAVWADLVGLTPAGNAPPGRFTDCFTGDPSAALPSAPPEPPQAALPGIAAPPRPRRTTVHRWGLVAYEDLPHPTRPGETVKAVVQTCPHCQCRRRRANTGRRLGARDMYSTDGVEWTHAVPACVMKRA